MCSCRTAGECLMEFHLWASTVNSPAMPFTLQFMHQVEQFMLEAHVSLQAFCQTMRWKNGLSLNQVNAAGGTEEVLCTSHIVALVSPIAKFKEANWITFDVNRSGSGVGLIIPITIKWKLSYTHKKKCEMPIISLALSLSSFSFFKFTAKLRVSSVDQQNIWRVPSLELPSTDSKSPVSRDRWWHCMSSCVQRQMMALYVQLCPETDGGTVCPAVSRDRWWHCIHVQLVHKWVESSIRSPANCKLQLLFLLIS